MTVSALCGGLRFLRCSMACSHLPRLCFSVRPFKLLATVGGLCASFCKLPPPTILLSTCAHALLAGPNYLEYNIVLNACACAGRIDLVSSVLDDLYDQKGVATAQHFTIALKAAAVAGVRRTLSLSLPLSLSHSRSPSLRPVLLIALCG